VTEIVLWPISLDTAEMSAPVQVPLADAGGHEVRGVAGGEGRGGEHGQPRPGRAPHGDGVYRIDQPLRRGRQATPRRVRGW
jgi:hypothetical protein